jgi:hypothetical protein
VCSISVFSQTVKNISVTGRVLDTLGETVPAATIMLLNNSDSTLINYTTTNSDGHFRFKSVRNTGCLLKISHISFMPIQRLIPVIDNSEFDFGIITVEPIASILMEVVIKSAKAPLFIHGDTVEYDARLFKVPPGSTVEDLLRRLPGIDIDESGNISTMGKDVRRIYVDGKTFFGDDAASVTKNLDAEAISKVQVYDNKSEQERLTGIDDGTDDKVMNLELKDEYKNGQFGKASVAGGTDWRWALRGSYNKFNEKSQLSFIGYGNNINSSGVNWDDYTEFKGNSAYSDYDNGDFGFGGGGNPHRQSSSMPGSYFDGKGFTENYGAGVNYNYFDKKTKFNFGYFYNQTDLNYEQFTLRQTFLPDTSYFRFDTINNYRFNNSHSVSSRVEIDIDSSNTVIFRVNARFAGSITDNFKTQLFQTPSFYDINSNNTIDSTDFDSYSINALGLYSHKFKKKGRTLAVSGVADLSNNVSIQNTENDNQYFLSLTPSEQMKLLYDNSNDDKLIKSSIMYVEPFGKRLSLMSFYNISLNMEESGKVSQDALNGNAVIDSLSNYYYHNVLYNRIGTSLNYAWQGLNVTLGGAFQVIDLSGRYASSIESTDFNEMQSRKYQNFIPYASANLELPNNLRFRTNYSYNVNEPSMSQLQPVADLSNPFYRVNGNINLVPERSHNIGLNMYYWSQASFSSFGVSTGTILNENTIVYNQNTDFVDGLGYVTVSTPENVDGGKNTYLYLWSSVPIIKTILSLKLSGSMNYGESPIFINEIENITKSKYYNGKLALNLTIGPKLNFNVGGGVSQNRVTYSIQSQQNQSILSYSSSAGIKWQFAKKTYLEANLDWDNYFNDRLNYETDVMLVNVSVRQLLGEKNRFEIRLAAFDVMNEKLFLQQTASANYTEYTSSPTLARYFMLSVAYNLKGFDTKVKKRGRH